MSWINDQPGTEKGNNLKTSSFFKAQKLCKFKPLKMNYCLRTNDYEIRIKN